MESARKRQPRKKLTLLQVFIKFFLRGLLFFVPTAATVYAVYWVFTALDAWVEPILKRRVPGAGIVLTVVLITLTGFLATNYATRWLFGVLDDLLVRTPVLNLLYTSLKDVLGAFVGAKKRFDRPVLVSLGGGTELATVGFVTRDSLDELGLSEHVAVYVPTAYNIGGNVLVVPRAQVRPLQAEPSAVMTFVVSGGIAGGVEGGVAAKK